ncbi:hypothetical protein EPO15_10980 [bacterium]|nr:MAG: hypothetical protein EPO15_10980 [bacterium]
MTHFKPTAVSALLCALLSVACTSRVAVRKDLSVAKGASPKVEASVVLLDSVPPAAAEVSRGGDHTAIVGLQPGLSHAVASMLEGTFARASQAAGAESAPAADFLAEYRIVKPDSYREEFQVELREPGEAPRFAKSWPVLETTPMGNKFIGMLSFIPPFYFLMPVSAASKATRTRDALEHDLLKGLSEFSAELRRDVPAYLKNKARALAAEERGDAAASADPSGASAAYLEALAAADPHRKIGRRVLGRFIALTARTGAPAASEAAKESMARGKVLIGRAASPADFRPAVEAMEQAVTAAPGWASGHFNTALAHEGAGDWLAASEHFAAYLALKPGAEDAEEVRRKIVELKVRDEKGDKPGGQ